MCVCVCVSCVRVVCPCRASVCVCVCVAVVCKVYISLLSYHRSKIPIGAQLVSLSTVTEYLEHISVFTKGDMEEVPSLFGTRLPILFPTPLAPPPRLFNSDLFAYMLEFSCIVCFWVIKVKELASPPHLMYSVSSEITGTAQQRRY